MFRLLSCTACASANQNDVFLLLSIKPYVTTFADPVSPITYLPGFSDRLLLYFTLNIPTNHSPRMVKQILDYRKANFMAINTRLSIFLDDFAETFCQRPVENNWCLNSPWHHEGLKQLSNKKKNFLCCETFKASPSFQGLPLCRGGV